MNNCECLDYEMQRSSRSSRSSRPEGLLRKFSVQFSAAAKLFNNPLDGIHAVAAELRSSSSFLSCDCPRIIKIKKK